MGLLLFLWNCGTTCYNQRLPNYCSAADLWTFELHQTLQPLEPLLEAVNVASSAVIYSQLVGIAPCYLGTYPHVLNTTPRPLSAQQDPKHNRWDLHILPTLPPFQPPQSRPLN